MVYEALRHYADAGISARFVSNVDPADLVAKLDGLDPATTLFIVASKTFSTLETLTNATAARRWLTDALGDAAVSKHFVAVSTNKRLVDEFGIDTDNMFGFWDWVGGRYSVDSAIGLSVMAVIGRERVRGVPGRVPSRRRALPYRAAGRERAGAARPDRPVVLEFLRRAVTCGAAVLQRPVPVRGLPAAADDGIQRQVGARRRHARSPPTPARSIWGEPGTNGQHAFYQLLHQGTRLVPADFIGLSQPTDDLPTADGTGSMHDLLMSNFFAQTQVLAFGKTAEEIAAEGTPAGCGAAQGDARQPADDVDPGDQADPVGGGPADRPLRAPGVHRGRRSGASTRSTSGASNWARRRPRRCCRCSPKTPHRPSSPTARPTRWCAATAANAAGRPEPPDDGAWGWWRNPRPGCIHWHHRVRLTRSVRRNPAAGTSGPAVPPGP